MKFLRQFFVIALFSLMGEALNFFLPLPIPASIYGLILLFAALCSGFLKLDSVKDAGHFLLSIMPPMFVPPAIALLANLEVLRSHWAFFLAVGILSTVVVMAVSGWTSQILIRINGKNRQNPEGGEVR